MIKLIGNYLLNLEIGDEVVPISPGMINVLTITLDIDRILPTFKMVLKDASGLLGEIFPYDNSSSSIGISVARSSNLDRLNQFKFRVKRRNVTQDRFYEVEGLLDVEGLLSPQRGRALTGNLKTSLERISAEELEISSTEVGASLDYDKRVLQPQWTNIKLLRYLKKNLGGRNNEAGYYCFIKNQNGEKIFVFKSTNELFSSSLRYKFIVSHKQYQDFYPVMDYRLLDNSGLLSDFGAQDLNHYYFDYNSGTYEHLSSPISGYSGLTQNFLIDKDNDSEFKFTTGLGRSNAFTEDFSEKIRNILFDKLTNLAHMWISTWGLENISPGDIVLVIFGEALKRGKLFSYQHAGYWMVKRVVHIIGQTYLTNLLLVRAGVDTDIETSLVEVSKQAQK